MVSGQVYGSYSEVKGFLLLFLFFNSILCHSFAKTSQFEEGVQLLRKTEAGGLPPVHWPAWDDSFLQ